MDIKKLVVFPYHPDIELMIRHQKALKGVWLIGICSYKEDRKIVEEINKRLNCAINETSLIEQSNVILLMENYRNYKIDKYYEIIDMALELGKEVWIAPRILKYLDLKKYKGKYQVLKNKLEESKLQKSKLQKRLYQIDVPVTAVVGMGKNCCKFENQLEYKLLLEKEGYKVSWISSNELAKLFGGYVFPESFYSNTWSYENKVITLNHFIYNLLLEENSDIIILGVPEGVVEFEEGEMNHFGEYALIAGNAVNIDNAILCLYFMEIENEKAVMRMCNYTSDRFLIPISIVSIGRNTYEVEDGAEKKDFLSFLE